MRILFFIPVYPKVSETFILRELHELEKLGFKGLVLSFKSGGEKKKQPLLAKIRFETLYLVPQLLKVQNALEFSKSVTRFAICRPGKFLKIIYQLFQGGELFLSNLRILVKLLLVFDKLSAFKPQVIVTHYGIISADVATILSFLLDVPFGCVLHTYDLFVDNQYLTKRLRRASFIIVRSQFSKNYLKKYLDNVDRVKVIRPGGIDTDFFKPVLKSKKTNKIIAVGRLVEQKGFAYLIEVCFLLKKKGFGFKCQIIGTGPEEKKLKRRVKKLRLQEEVGFLGPMVHDKKFLKTLASAKVFVLPSVVARNNDRDILANSMCEAMACGLPVITTKVNAVDDFIKNGENGFLVPEADSRALAQCLENIFARKQPSLVKIGKEARETIIKEFDSLGETKKFVKIIRRVVKEYHPGV